MTERQFTEDRLAALYDVFHPPQPRDDFNFYLPLVMTARSVLDVGCGTGALLRWARETGHTGRLCGLDPAEGMLNQARQRTDIEWVLGDLSSVAWNREFDLVVMTGHAFQQLITNDEIRTALAAIRSALTDGGRFGFETRNPLDRAWERWPVEYGAETTDASGTVVRREHRAETPVEGDIVRFTVTFSSPGWEHSRVSPAMLRFLDTDALSAFLSGAGLAIEEQFGDWNRQPVADTSPEIITIARKGTAAARTSRAAQATVMTHDVPATVPPAMPIQGENMGAVHPDAVRHGAEVLYPLTDESWGVRCCFVTDPDGTLVHAMKHRDAA